MEASDITADTVREVLASPDPMLEALSVVLREISHDAVGAVAGMLTMMGVDPGTFPGEYLLQSLLVESEKVFKGITRDNWIKVYDSYVHIKGILEANPELKAQVEAYENTPVPSAPVETPDAEEAVDAALDALLNGKF